MEGRQLMSIGPFSVQGALPGSSGSIVSTFGFEGQAADGCCHNQCARINSEMLLRFSQQRAVCHSVSNKASPTHSNTNKLPHPTPIPNSFKCLTITHLPPCHPTVIQHQRPQAWQRGACLIQHKAP